MRYCATTEVLTSISAVEEVVRARVSLCVVRRESVNCFTCFTFSLVITCGFFGLLWVLVFLVVVFLVSSLDDQSLRSSCLPITILAQLQDCHSCYDERSIVQTRTKKSMGFEFVLADSLQLILSSRIGIDCI